MRVWGHRLQISLFSILFRKSLPNTNGEWINPRENICYYLLIIKPVKPVTLHALYKCCLSLLLIVIPKHLVNVFILTQHSFHCFNLYRHIFQPAHYVIILNLQLRTPVHWEQLLWKFTLKHFCFKIT